MSSASPPVIALRRENKLREMRAALSPANVGALVQQGFRVLVQPSSLRAFPLDEYISEGAEAAEDLSEADVILGVKEIPPQHLIPHKTHLFFSHTLKAQPYSMPLLDALLSQKVRLLDYEGITVHGERGGKRLVAFGRFAGIVGAVDILRGIGERALALGHSTPFLGIAAAWQYPTLLKAFEAVQEAGRAIRLSGLPPGLCPFSIAVTGLCGMEGGGGRVALGAKEVLDAMGVVWVTPTHLPSTLGAARGKALTHCIYATGLDIQDVVALGPPPSSEGEVGLEGVVEWEKRDVEQWVRGGSKGAPPFDRAHYKANPTSYRPVYHTRLAPHTSLLIHCSYWEPRFPRLLTRQQIQALSESGQCRLLGVSDISCDLGGAIEWSTQATTIQTPFYLFDPLTGRSVANDISALPGANVCIGGGGDGAGSSHSPIGRGILTHAVDHLPSEVPRDATEHFGACLLPFLPQLARNCKDPTTPLPLELQGAMVTSEGSLTPTWAFIATLRAAHERSLAILPPLALSTPLPASSPILCFLSGHIFDQGVLSNLLDIVEDGKCCARIVDCKVGGDRGSVTKVTVEVLVGAGAVEGGLVPVTRAIGALCASKEVGITLQGRGEGGVSDLVEAALKAGREEGKGLVIALPGTTSTKAPPLLPSPSPSSPRFPPTPRILVLGSGFCSSPCVKILRSFNYVVTIGSAVLSQAQVIAACFSHVTPVFVEVREECLGLLSDLCSQHSAVVSLVPAHLHHLVARACISSQTNLITASYISPPLAELHSKAALAGITVLNECGLDPGLDHMTVCRFSDAVTAKGGKITSLSSSCGGLPAPASANNPLGYKWTWSPRGALLAMNNGASFLEEGRVQTVGAGGGRLLASSSPFNLPQYPAFALERLPNRDSMPYATKYGIEGSGLVHFQRGTLRYAGFSQNLELLAAVGLLEVGPMALPPSLLPLPSLPSLPLLTLLAALLSLPLESTLEEVCGGLLAKCVSPSPLPLHRACSFLTWIGCPHSAKVELVIPDGDPTRFHPLDTLLTCLGNHPGLALSPRDQDLVLMVHEFSVDFPSHTEHHTSTLVEFGEANGMTSMARLVGFTVAAATKTLVEGGAAMNGLGMVSPTTPLFYDPILRVLEGLGVKMSESVRVVPK